MTDVAAARSAPPARNWRKAYAALTAEPAGRLMEMAERL